MFLVNNQLFFAGFSGHSYAPLKIEQDTFNFQNFQQLLLYKRAYHNSRMKIVETGA